MAAGRLAPGLPASINRVVPSILRMPSPTRRSSCLASVPAVSLHHRSAKRRTEKGPHEHALPPMTERLRGLISSSHFEKLVDRDLCSSRVPKAACCRSRVCQCIPQCSLPAGASLVCRFFRSCLSGPCSVTVRAPSCTRAAACMLFRVVAMRCRFAGDRHVPDLVDLVAVETTTGFWITEF